MSEDRIEEIKKLSKDRSYYTNKTVTNSDVSWLISELEQSRDVVKRLNKMQPVANVTLSDDAKHFESLAKKAEAENKELQAVFDLQETRTKKAEHLWQQATGKHSTLPDLGVLLDWLMGEIKQLEQLINDWLEDKDE